MKFPGKWFSKVETIYLAACRLHFVILPLLLVACLSAGRTAAQGLTISGTNGSFIDHLWKKSPDPSMPFNDVNTNGGFPNSIDITGINSIQVTWNAPSGYMYVVKPPPLALGALYLAFYLEYGGNSSLGRVSSSTASFNGVSGTAPSIFGGAEIREGLLLSAGSTINPGDGSFSFTSFTITAGFSGPNPSGALLLNAGPWASKWFLSLSGGNRSDPTDPGQLLTLQPVPEPELSLLSLAVLCALISFKFSNREFFSALITDRCDRP